MYKVLNRENNQFLTFKTYEEACQFKGLDPKKGFRYRRRTADRPKDFTSAPLLILAAQNKTAEYMAAWLKLNHLKAA